MPLLRYRSPDDPAFSVFDQSRFRVDHATFLLDAGEVRSRIEGLITERAGWNLAAMKLVEEQARLVACRDWIATLPDEGDAVHTPEFKHEPAIDLVADRLVADGRFAHAHCPACDAVYRSGQVTRDAWKYAEGSVTAHGHRLACPQGHVIHALTDEVDVAELDFDDEPAGPSTGRVVDL